MWNILLHASRVSFVLGGGFLGSAFLLDTDPPLFAVKPS